MRRFVIASHAHFAQGIAEALAFLVGEREDLATVCLFVDGNDDVAVAATEAVGAGDDEVVVCCDILGGSVCNEFTKLLAKTPNLHVVANMSLPLLISLLFSDPAEPIEEVVRQAVASPDVAPKYVNDLVASEDVEEEEF